MKKRKYFIKSINFGKEGDMSRTVIEKIPEQKLSEVVRRAIVNYFYIHPEFKEAKIRKTLEDRKDIKDKILSISKELKDNEKTLTKLGYKLNELE